MKRFSIFGALALGLAGCGGGGDDPKEEPVTLLDRVETYSEGFTEGVLTASSILKEFSIPTNYQQPAGKAVEVCVEGTITQKLHQSGSFSFRAYLDYNGSPKNFTSTANGAAGVDLVLPFKVCGGTRLGIQLRADNCGAVQCSGPFGGYLVTARWTAKTVP